MYSSNLLVTFEVTYYLECWNLIWFQGSALKLVTCWELHTIDIIALSLFLHVYYLSSIYNLQLYSSLFDLFFLYGLPNGFLSTKNRKKTDFQARATGIPTAITFVSWLLHSRSKNTTFPAFATTQRLLQDRPNQGYQAFGLESTEYHQNADRWIWWHRPSFCVLLCLARPITDHYFI